MENQLLENQLSELRIIDSTGDTRLTWDKDNKDDVAAARNMFKELKSKGYLAYSVSKKGKKKNVIHTFDPDAQLIIMAPQMQGG